MVLQFFWILVIILIGDTFRFKLTDLRYVYNKYVLLCCYEKVSAGSIYDDNTGDLVNCVLSCSIKRW